MKNIFTIKKWFASALLLCCFITNLYSQQTNTMMFMDRIPQSNLYNPAYVTPADWHISPFVFLLIPTVGLSANVPTDLNDFFVKNGDKWLNPYHEDANHLQTWLSSLPEFNQVETEFRLSPLNFGFKIGDENYIGFDWSINVYEHAAIPTSLLEFPTKGNVGMPEADFSDMSLYTVSYQEFALTYARQINDQLTVGASLKYLNGMAVASLQAKQFELITAENSTKITAKADVEVKTNYPIDSVSYDEDGLVDEVYETDLDVSDIEDLAIFPKNNGVALDLGIVFRPKENITLQLAAKDLGFINWAESPSSFLASNEFDFQGVYFNDIDSPIDEKYEGVLDSLISGFEFTHSTDKFKTNLPMKLYLGAEYQYDETVSVALVGRSRKYQKHWNNSVTAILNLRIFRYGALAFSYSMKNRKINTVGFGGTLRMGPLQWYLVADNALVYLMRDDARNVSLNLGANFVFGRTPKYKYPKNLPFIDIY